MTVYNRDRLIALIKEHALQFGSFVLASGKTASFYLDCRQLTLHPQGANQVGAGMLQLLGSPLPDAIGGMAIGATQFQPRRSPWRASRTWTFADSSFAKKPSSTGWAAKWKGRLKPA